MSLAAFGTLPPGVLTTSTPFTFTVPKEEQTHLKNLVRQAAIGVPSYYNTHTDATNISASHGISRDWLVHAQETWTSCSDYSWPKEQARLNNIPNFLINVTATPVPGQNPSSENQNEEKQTFTLHFAALFSRHPDATPLLLLHGWPGSYLEFLSVLELLAAKYTPDTLPYHVVVPSLPDYGLSTRSGEVATELTMAEAVGALDGLMTGLGFGAGDEGEGYAGLRVHR